MSGLDSVPGTGGGQISRPPGAPAPGGVGPPEPATDPKAPAKGPAPAPPAETPAAPQTTPGRPDALALTLGAAKLTTGLPLPTPGQVLGQAAAPGDVTGQGTAGATATAGEQARYATPEEFPEDLKAAFEALAQAPFGTKVPGRAAGPGATQALFKQYQVIPHDLLKKNPAAFLFLNTLVSKYPPSEIRRMAEKNGVDLEKVVMALVLEPPAQPETIAKLAGQHRLGADRAAVLKQAEQLANGADPLHQLAGRFTRTVLGNNPQALQTMLTDPLTYFGAQLWAKLGKGQQEFVADGSKTRKATGLLQRGGLSAKGLAWVIGEDGERQDQQQGGQHQGQGMMSAAEIAQQKAFYDGWRESLIKGIKESADAKAGLSAGPPKIEAFPVSDLGATRAVYDPVRRVVRLSSAFPECVRTHTHGLTLTVAPDGELLEIALRNPQDRWELKKDLAPPVLAGIEPARARLVAPREGEVFQTHDRFYTSHDRNVIYLQVEKRPVARRVLAAANVMLELDDGGHLLGILIWQLSAAKSQPPGDQKAWIAGLAERGPRIRPS